MKELATSLNDRTLRYDGVSIFEPQFLAGAVARGLPPSMIRVRGDDEDVRRFNEMVAEADRIRQETVEPVSLSMVWQLPEQYKNLNLDEYVARAFGDRCQELYKKYSPEQYDQAILRIADELQEIEARGMVEFMRTVIYILDTFKRKNVVWGVGRGSSCASYVLFVLGLHAVDCILLDVPMSEFFHD